LPEHCCGIAGYNNVKLPGYMQYSYHIKRRLKCLAFFCIILIVNFLTPEKLHAKHIIGGEMTYRFVQMLNATTARYEFTLIIYRDCDSGGGQLDNPANIGIYRGNINSATLFDDFQTDLSSITNVDPVIPPCADVSAVSGACVQRGVYIFTYDLPVSNQSYFVVYQRCCRTEQIVNIANPGNYGATYMVEITPLAQTLQNSSPTFLNYPPTFICQNFPLDFDHSAIDMDGDSLVYSFCSPLDGGGQGGGGGGGNNNCNSTVPNPPCGPPFDLVNFIGSYTVLEPMGGIPTIGVNDSTGHLFGTPVTVGQYVVGICVQEYRNGILLGTILRDFQFNVVDCTPSIIAKLQAPLVGIQTYEITKCAEKLITVLNASPQGPDLTSWRWELDLPNGQIFTSTTWHLTANLPDFGTYTARLYLNPNPTSPDCRDTAYVTIKAFPGVNADFGFSYDVCKETPVAFSDSSVSGANGGILSWVWTFGAGTDSAFVRNPVFEFPSYGSYPVRLWLVDADGCKDDIIQLVNWEPQLVPDIPALEPQKICLPDVVEFRILENLNLNNYTIQWDFGDGNLGAEQTPVHTYENPGIYQVSVAITSPFDCFATDTFPEAVSAYPSPTANFDYSPRAVSNLNNTVTFKNLSDSTSAVWNWQFGAAGQSSQANPVYVFLQDTGLTPIKLTAWNQYGCPDSLTKFVDVVPLARLYVPNAFKPFVDNGSGNDRFGISGILPAYSDFSMTIWSRWGEMLFRSEDPARTWDGRRGDDGRVMPPGVYVYIVHLKGPRGEPIDLQGTVTLF
jgi:PKD repeat protein